MSPFEQIKQQIQTRSSFVMEAGAGSGKTFALIQTLTYILEEHEKKLEYEHKSIVCITYTNVAKNEIIDRIEHNPNVLVLTIHEFLWSNISNFQNQLLTELDILNSIMASEKPDKFQVNLIARGNVKEVIYNDSGYRDFERGMLHHDDVITIAAKLFQKYPTLTSIIAEKFPFIFIDEYQDTAPETVSSFIENLLERHKPRILLGFFGDSHQKIYDGGVGDLEKYINRKCLTLITKSENYRSKEAVINLLNNIRDNIKQVIPNDRKSAKGSAIFINCDNYPIKEKKQGVLDYEESLKPKKNSNYDNLIKTLSKQGWNFGDKSKDKILIIANSRVAERSGFGALYKLFSTRYGEGANDQLLKREHPLVRFFLGSVDKKTSKERAIGIEHLMAYWSNRDISNVVHYLNTYNINYKQSDQFVTLHSHSDKARIVEQLNELNALRNTSSTKEVFDFIRDNGLVSLKEGVLKYIERINTSIPEDEEGRERLEKDKHLFNAVMELPYNEFVKLFGYTQNQTVFTTKHGTKGDQYRNVLVIIDDTSWKQKYNFEKFINQKDDDHERTIRTRNLFYVSCSRAIDNLVIISLSQMGPDAMNVIGKWFNIENVFSIDNYLQLSHNV